MVHIYQCPELPPKDGNNQFYFPKIFCQSNIKEGIVCKNIFGICLPVCPHFQQGHVPSVQLQLIFLPHLFQRELAVYV